MPNDTPTEAVLSMRQQGLSNNQIVTALQREGYTSPQVLDAMNQADSQEQITRPFDGGTTMNNPNTQQQGAGMASADAGYPVAGDELASTEEGNISTERIEELAEAIIDEKWNDLMDNINRIIEWKEKTETRVVQMETMMKSMKDDFDKMHSSILEKVGEYDHNITDVGTEVKALEKVFQKVLPGFMENVTELSRITQAMKNNEK